MRLWRAGSSRHRMAGTNRELAICFIHRSARTTAGKTRPGHPPAGVPTQAASVRPPMRWGRFLALRNHAGKGVLRVNEGSPAKWRLKQAAS